MTAVVKAYSTVMIQSCVRYVMSAPPSYEWWFLIESL